MTDSAVKPVGRFAPSPTGQLHLGNLRTALASWLSVKSRGGKWIVRIEDVDTARCCAELADQHLRDLAALGLESDEPVVWQSRRGDLYREALDKLAKQGKLYRCACSRKDLQLLASALQSEGNLKPYPGTCRAAKIGEFIADALRLELPLGEVHWNDLLLGEQSDDPVSLTGDPVLHRRDGCFAYHLAVVVDDGRQGVNEIVRGADLREVTSTQIRLQQMLGYSCPNYAHLGLVTGPDGSRLGKRVDSASLSSLIADGTSVPEIIGWLGWTLGCLDLPDACRAEDLIGRFAWNRVRKDSVSVPAGWVLTNAGDSF